MRLLLNLYIILFAHFCFSQSVEFSEEEKLWIKNHPKINFGYEPKWAPYEIYQDNRYQGIVGDYVKRIEEATGIDMEPIPNITWKESITGLKNGTINIVPCCAITPEREEYLEFTDLYINDPMVIVTANNFDFVGGLEDLSSKTIALPKEYYTSEVISKDYPKIKIDLYNSVEECLEAVSFGKADAFVGNLGVISYHINATGFTNLKIAAPTSYKRNGIALAVTKDWIVFRDIANKVFQSISFKERSEIRNNWISVRYEHGIQSSEVLKWILVIGIAIILLFAQFYYWNRSLRKENLLKSQAQEQLNESLVLINAQHEEKKLLLKEIHHRIKNNLQIVTSVMNLRSNTVDDQTVHSIIEESVERVNSIALIHDKIYNSNDVKDVVVKDYINSLVYEIIDSLDHQRIKFSVDSNVDSLDMDRLVPLALILTELLTNSIKYGLKDLDDPKIEIALNMENSVLALRYFDNGTWIEGNSKVNFGTTLINALTKQLSGDYELKKSDKGTLYQFKFNLTN